MMHGLRFGVNSLFSEELFTDYNKKALLIKEKIENYKKIRLNWTPR